MVPGPAPPLRPCARFGQACVDEQLVYFGFRQRCSYIYLAWGPQSDLISASRAELGPREGPPDSVRPSWLGAPRGESSQAEVTGQSRGFHSQDRFPSGSSACADLPLPPQLLPLRGPSEGRAAASPLVRLPGIVGSNPGSRGFFRGPFLFAGQAGTAGRPSPVTYVREPSFHLLCPCRAKHT